MNGRDDILGKLRSGLGELENALDQAAWDAAASYAGEMIDLLDDLIEFVEGEEKRERDEAFSSITRRDENG
jgi:hypothetical protein